MAIKGLLENLDTYEASISFHFEGDDYTVKCELWSEDDYNFEKDCSSCSGYDYGKDCVIQELWSPGGSIHVFIDGDKYWKIYVFRNDIPIRLYGRSSLVGGAYNR
jgi:hypothetical protein